ncbi:MAG: prohibitin family protein [Oscillospiraceae bacterium]|nr:prohibitin family protein [Oscillospiraceae bacterium]
MKEKEYVNAVPVNKAAGKIARGIAAAVIAVIAVCSSVAIVPAGHTGVVLTLGKVSSTSYQEGFHLKAPFIQQIEVMSNKIQVYETSATAVSKDLQSVSSNIAVNYKISSDQSAKIYQTIGREYESIILMPAVQESMKSVTAKYTAEELITERAVVGEEIKNTLENKVKDYGIIIEKFNIVNFDFSSEFNAAIEAKQVAEQNLLKTKTEQQQAIVIAEAEAKKKTIAAEAQAKATLTEANAQAEANNLLNNSLSELIIKYEQIEKWNGELPKVMSDAASLIDVGISDSAAPSGTGN